MRFEGHELYSEIARLFGVDVGRVGILVDSAADGIGPKKGMFLLVIMPERDERGKLINDHVWRTSFAESFNQLDIIKAAQQFLEQSKERRNEDRRTQG